MLRLALSLLLLAAAACASDSPVTIGDGTPLTISLAPTEKPWVPSGASQINHPKGRAAVTRVEVTYGNGTSLQPPVDFTKQKCEVDITYGTLTVKAITNPNGGALRVTTSGTFKALYTHPNGTVFISNDQNSTITGLTILRDNKPIPNVPSQPDPIKVVIHYE